MDAAHGATPARQGDINGFRGKALVQLITRELLATRVEQRFDLLLDPVDAGAFGFLLIRGSCASPFMKPVMTPFFPRNFAFSFSSEAESVACSNLSLA